MTSRYWIRVFNSNYESTLMTLLWIISRYQHAYIFFETHELKTNTIYLNTVTCMNKNKSKAMSRKTSHEKTRLTVEKGNQHLSAWLIDFKLSFRQKIYLHKSSLRWFRKRASGNSHEDFMEHENAEWEAESEHNNEIIIFLIYRPSEKCVRGIVCSLPRVEMRNVTEKWAIIFRINSLQDNKKSLRS